MDKSISAKQLVFLTVLYSLGNLFIIISSVQFRYDFWTSFLVGAVIAIPFIFIYSKILELFPNKNLYQIIMFVLGKVWGRVVIIFFVFYTLYLGAIALSSCSEFIVILNLTKTPMIAVMGIIILICIMFSRCGIDIIGKSTLYLFPIIAVIIIGSLILSFQYGDISNLMPFNIARKSEFISKCLSAGAIPFGEFVVVTTLIKKDNQKKSIFKPMLFALLFTAILVVLLYFRNVLVLGQRAQSMYYFPSYEAVSIISIGDFLFRIEILVCIFIIINSIIRISILIASLSEALTHLLGFGTEKTFSLPSGILIFTLGTVIFKNTVQITEWVNYYPYFLIPLEVVLPVIIFIFVIIKAKKKQSGSMISNNK